MHGFSVYNIVINAWTAVKFAHAELPKSTLPVTNLDQASYCHKLLWSAMREQEKSRSACGLASCSSTFLRIVEA